MFQKPNRLSSLAVFASALSVYLLGTAVGAMVYQALLRQREFHATLRFLLIGLASTCLLGMMALARAREVYEGILSSLNFGTPAAVIAEMAVALLVFGLPTLMMGATFSHLAQTARHAGGGVGRALGLNTLGGAIAAPDSHPVGGLHPLFKR